MSTDDGPIVSTDTAGRAPLLGRLLSGLLGLVIFAAFGVALVLLAIAMLPAHSPRLGDNPSWLDYLIDNRWVIWVFRLGGLLAGAMFLIFAIYFMRSIVHRIRKGHWLRSGGPFQAEIVEKAEDEFEAAASTYESLWQQAEEKSDALEQQLSQTNEVVKQLFQQLTAAYGELEARRSEEEPPSQG